MGILFRECELKTICRNHSFPGMFLKNVYQMALGLSIYFHFLKMVFIFKFSRFKKHVSISIILRCHRSLTSSKKDENVDLLFSVLGLFLKIFSEKMFYKFFANVFSLLFFVFFENENRKHSNEVPLFAKLGFLGK